MLTDILKFLEDIITGGFLGQAILATIIWGAIAVLLTHQVAIDDRVYDAGFIILGYFFHVVTAARASAKITTARRRADNCEEALNGSYKVE